MASISRKSTSTKWIACFTDAEGVQRQRSTGIPDTGTPVERAEARRRAMDIAAGFEVAARGHPTEAQIRRTLTELYNKVNPERRLEWATVGPFLTQWLERVKVRKSGGTHSRYATVIERFISGLGAKASVHLGELTTEDFQSFLDREMKSGKRGGTLRIEIKILNAAMAYAMRQGLIITNPVAAADAPTDGSESKRPFTIDQIRAMISACDPDRWAGGDKIVSRLSDWRTVITIGAFTGLRLGDACNLRWKSVDLENRVLRLRAEKTKMKKKDLVLPIHADLYDRLKEILSREDPLAPIAPTLAGSKIGGRSGLSRQFQRIMEKAGIENETVAGGEGNGRRMLALSFHSMRHTYVTALADAGVAQDLRQALGGHSSAKVSEIYTHRGQATLADAVAKLPGL